MTKRNRNTEAQKRANAKYKREKTQQFAMRFFPGDAGIWEHLQKQPNRAEYIRELIRKDMLKS